MGRRGTSLPRRTMKSPTIKNQPTKISQPKPQQPLQTGNQSIGSTIGQGMAIGAGAAIGSSVINGAINTMSGSNNNNTPPDNTNNSNNSNNINNSFNCSDILESFQNCMYSHNDTVLCKPQLDLFNKCVNQNN